MTQPDLDRDVYIVCECEARCRKDQHPISSTLLGEGARCSVWISRRHLAIIAATTNRRIKQEEACSTSSATSRRGS